MVGVQHSEDKNITIKEFRQNDQLSAKFAEILRDETLQLALALCEAAAPANGGVIFDNIKEPHFAHIQLGIDRGYNLFSRVFRALALPWPKDDQLPEPTYAPPEEELEEANA